MMSKNRIKVISPRYVKLLVNVDIYPNLPENASLAERQALEELKQFLHPLDGGMIGEGWPFGQLPCLADFYVLFDKISVIDHVENLMINATIEDPK